MQTYDAVIVGGGAAGLMCALSAGQKGLRVLVVEQANKVGRKILMSGGGRCNFTNLYTEPENFLSVNPHFCKSALSQYSQWNFIDLVCQHRIPYHEKTLGQLFCDNSAKDIVQLLLTDCYAVNVIVKTRATVHDIKQTPHGFSMRINDQPVESGALVIATGGLSIPSMGPHGFGYRLAEQFGLPVLPVSAGLVPFIMPKHWTQQWVNLAGTSLPVIAQCDEQSFKEAMLVTHKGLSGPAILQISSYWKPEQTITLNLSPERSLLDVFIEQKHSHPNSSLKKALAGQFSKNFASHLCETVPLTGTLNRSTIGKMSDKDLAQLAEQLHAFKVTPETTEGYKTAEVTLGGVDTSVLSSKTMMVKDIPGLFFIGEVVDVTGHLGGYNFQWAWSSGWVAGQNLG